jgi:hypothetical protein
VCESARCSNDTDQLAFHFDEMAERKALRDQVQLITYPDRPAGDLPELHRARRSRHRPRVSAELGVQGHQGQISRYSDTSLIFRQAFGNFRPPPQQCGTHNIVRHRGIEELFGPDLGDPKTWLAA